MREVWLLDSVRTGRNLLAAAEAGRSPYIFESRHEGWKADPVPPMRSLYLKTYGQAKKVVYETLGVRKLIPLEVAYHSILPTGHWHGIGVKSWMLDLDTLEGNLVLPF